MSGNDRKVDIALWMLAQLDQPTQAGVRRRLALRLEPPSSPTEQRRHRLSFVAELLRQVAPPLGWSFSYVPRIDYDAKRPPHAPSSASLVNQYGSWISVCKHAHPLTASPSRLLAGPWQARERQRGHRRYSREDVVTALRACAHELGRVPSTKTFTRWRTAANHRSRRSHYPSATTIGQLYAKRGNWIAALEDAELIPPTANTVRVITSDCERATELLAAARASGFIAAHAGKRNWIELRGALADVKRWARTNAIASADPVTFWEPVTMRT